MLTISFLAVLLLAPHANAARPWQWQYKVWMPAVWVRLAYCESGTRPPQDPDWRHHGGVYEGALGFHHGSWLRFKRPRDPEHAYDASPWAQYQAGLAIWRRYRFTGWGCYRHSWVRNG